MHFQHSVTDSHAAKPIDQGRWAPGMGAVVIGDGIYVAGGGPQMGGGVKECNQRGFQAVRAVFSEKTDIKDSDI